ncbi:hypothetical protein [Candidatus Soleaferrea massiliensis]|uniref:hypothetical protein n=1 Tax=Candidatus Soleaferrea massiliensis TaxID=1470354 RepID=UPI0012E09FFC|nr:hypothetical protein [Candidatus Soleaferrea massiliensis]
MNVYGNLSTNLLTQILGTPVESVSKSIEQAMENIIQKSSALRRDKRAARISLSAEFRNSTDSGLEDSVISAYLNTSLVHEANH